MTKEEITLVDAMSKRPVVATLYLELAPTALVDTEAVWGPARVAAARSRAHAVLPIPEHWHWNWATKKDHLRLLANRCLGIECGGVMQGLMMINLARHAAVLDSDAGKPLVYIDFIENAPWNLKSLVDEPRYLGIGIRLFEAAVMLSTNEGFHGRVGLHSLPPSEPFYERTCGMTKLDSDPDKEDLAYFELSRASAAAFLKGRS